MTTAESTTTRHHPSWREVRDGFLADPEVQASYQELAPRFRWCVSSSPCESSEAGLSDNWPIGQA